MGKRIRFHDNGRTYYWDIAEQKVYTENGGHIPGICATLKEARRLVNRRYDK